MPNVTDYARLRRDIDSTETDLPNEEAEKIFAEAAEEYTGAKSIKAATRVIALQGMLASSVKEVDYKQNESSENLGDVNKHLLDLLRVWQKNLDDALAAEASSNAPGTRPPSFNGRVTASW